MFSLGDIERSGLFGKNSMASHQLHLKIKEARDERKLKRSDSRGVSQESLENGDPGKSQREFGRCFGKLSKVFRAYCVGFPRAWGDRGCGRGSCSCDEADRDNLGLCVVWGALEAWRSGSILRKRSLWAYLGRCSEVDLGLGFKWVLLEVLGDELPVSVNPSPEWKVVAQTTATGFLSLLWVCTFTLVENPGNLASHYPQEWFLFKGKLLAGLADLSSAGGTALNGCALQWI